MLRKYLDILCCPDDGARVARQGNDLQCSRCGRRFRGHAQNFFELLPSVFPSWGLSGRDERRKRVEQAYRHIFEQPFQWREESAGWGELSAASPGYRAFVKAEVEWIRRHLGTRDGMYIADVSGGVGNYSIPLARGTEMMVHCELDVDSIQTAWRRSGGSAGLFIRTPYNRLPFPAGVFDRVLCTDTLIRGWEHERMLLKEIIRILKPGGRAIVDFHNNRLHRNSDIRYYTGRQVRELLASVDCGDYEIHPFGSVPSLLVPRESWYPLLDGACRPFLPRQRHIAVITRAGGTVR